MPELVDVLAAEGIRLHVRVSSKRQLLAEIAGAASDATRIDQRTVLAALHERERLGSTGVGEGVALPHARLPGLDRLVALFWQLEVPIAFEAIDDEPVDLVFVLLVPQGAETTHLKTLAKIARRLRESAVRERLRTADDRTEAWRTLTHAGDRSQAA